MKSAIIGGTGVTSFPSLQLKEQIVSTTYGDVIVYVRQTDDSIVFMQRHGVGRNKVPPHLINYKANIEAMRMLKVQQAVAIYAVGSISSLVLPGCYGLIDQFIDLSRGGRDATFYTGSDQKVRHIPMIEPYSKRLRLKLFQEFSLRGKQVPMKGTYICTNGPRLETPAEISMFRKFGADYVGMTAATETILANEAEIDFAGIAFSVNWAAGLDAEGFSFVEEETLTKMVSELLDVSLKVLS